MDYVYIFYLISIRLLNTAAACEQKSLFKDVNANRVCSTSDLNVTCTSTCLSGYFYRDASTVKKFTCSDGRWDIDVTDAKYRTCLKLFTRYGELFVTSFYNASGAVDVDTCSINASIAVVAQMRTNIEATCKRPNQTEEILSLRLEYKNGFETDDSLCVGNLSASSAIFALNTNALKCNGSFHNLTFSAVKVKFTPSVCEQKWMTNITIPNRKGCVSCSPGYYVNAAENTCTPCGSYTYQSADGSTSCQPCPRGSMVSQDRTSCSAICPRGFVFVNDHSSCQPCPLNSFMREGDTSCTACPPGTSTKGQTGASVCKQDLASCDAGFYVNVTLDACLPCGPNEYQTEPGVTVCLPCSPGTMVTENRDTCEEIPRPAASTLVKTENTAIYVLAAILGVVFVAMVAVIVRIVIRARHRRVEKEKDDAKKGVGNSHENSNDQISAHTSKEEFGEPDFSLVFENKAFKPKKKEHKETPDAEGKTDGTIFETN